MLFNYINYTFIITVYNYREKKEEEKDISREIPTSFLISIHKRFIFYFNERRIKLG